MGIGFAAIFRLTRNILVLWPLVTPMGAFYNNLRAGDIELPWLSILGFIDVMMGMAAVLYIAHRYVAGRRAARLAARQRGPAPTRTATQQASAAGWGLSLHPAA